MMDRVCIFCGRTPVLKTMEHVIPLWLIKLSGANEVTTGISYTAIASGIEKNTNINARSFKFPACKKCNSKYSILESKTKTIIEKLINNEVVLEKSSIDVLLDWFDKLRIGLWLSQFYFDRQVLGVPHMNINGRIGTKDRILGIVITNQSIEGYNYLGTQTPMFISFPSCFVFRIRNIFFINISYDYLVSKNLGLPFPLSWIFVEDPGKFNAGMFISFNKIRSPVYNISDFDEGLWFAQAIRPKDNSIDIYYKNDYAKNKYLDASYDKFIPVLFNKKKARWLNNEKVSIQKINKINMITYIHKLSFIIVKHQLKHWNKYHRYTRKTTVNYRKRKKIDKVLIRNQNEFIKSYRKDYLLYKKMFKLLEKLYILKSDSIRLTVT